MKSQLLFLAYMVLVSKKLTSTNEGTNKIRIKFMDLIFSSRFSIHHSGELAISISFSETDGKQSLIFRCNLLIQNWNLGNIIRVTKVPSSVMW